VWQAGWWRVGCGALRTGCPCSTAFLFLCFFPLLSALPITTFLIRAVPMSIIFLSFLSSSNYFLVYLLPHFFITLIISYSDFPTNNTLREVRIKLKYFYFENDNFKSRLYKHTLTIQNYKLFNGYKSTLNIT